MTTPPAPQEVTSFTLRRNTTWSASSQNGEYFSMLDSEVVRMLGLDGEERWGRRLSIGALQSVTPCDGGWVILGESGAAFLSQEGLQQPWRMSNPRPEQVAADADGRCVLGVSPRSVGAWKDERGWVVADGAGRFSLYGKKLSSSSWEVSVNCEADCPIAIWGNLLAVAEERQVSFFSKVDGTRHGESIAVGEAKIIAMSATSQAMTLSRDDGSISLWFGAPR